MIHVYYQQYSEITLKLFFYFNYFYGKAPDPPFNWAACLYNNFPLDNNLGVTTMKGQNATTGIEVGWSQNGC